MHRETVVAMSKVSGLIAKIKGLVAEHVKPENLEAYKQIREMLCDCQEIMAIHCDCSPVRLIAGQVDEIMENADAVHQP